MSGRHQPCKTDGVYSTPNFIYTNGVTGRLVCPAHSVANTNRVGVLHTLQCVKVAIVHMYGTLHCQQACSVENSLLT